jgi:hypothetical protein
VISGFKGRPQIEGVLSTGRSGEHSNLVENKRQEAGENCIMKTLIISSLRLG